MLRDISFSSAVISTQAFTNARKSAAPGSEPCPSSTSVPNGSVSTSSASASSPKLMAVSTVSTMCR